MTELVVGLYLILEAAECKRKLYFLSLLLLNVYLIPLTAELSVSLCQTLCLCEIGGHTKVGSNVPIKSYININGLIGFLNIIFAPGNTVASLGGYLPDTIGWRWFVTTQLYIGVMSYLLLLQGFLLLQVPVTITAIISVSLALHHPKTDASDLMVKFKLVDWAGTRSLILTVFLLLFASDRGGIVSWYDHLNICTLARFPDLFHLLRCY